ncbi:MAG: NAD(P)H-hydrate dehydratase [Clostridia bacterium]|nr:NAD(P)H-hydrate dehydratase [Clostridia bacterium]
MTDAEVTQKTNIIDRGEALRYFLKPLKSEADKFANGKVMVIAGSGGMTGAAVLCARAAMHSGAGLVYSVLPGACLRSVENALPEAVKCPVGASGSERFCECDAERLEELSGGMDAVAIGPGLGRDPGTQKLVRRLLGSAKFAPDAAAVIADADGLYPFSGDLNALAEAAALRPGKLIITPHEGEAARLLGICREHVRAERPGCALRLADALSGGVAVLKGHETIVAAGEESTVNETGNAGMGTGGSGDVLTGITAALAAGARMDCQPLKNIVKFAVAVHGLAGDVMAKKHSQRFITASDIITGLGELTEYA